MGSAWQKSGQSNRTTDWLTEQKIFNLLYIKKKKKKNTQKILRA